MSYQLKYRLLSSLLMSLLMAFVMSGCIISMTFNGDEEMFLLAWREAFFLAWPIAFPTAFFLQPIVQYLVKKVIPES